MALISISNWLDRFGDLPPGPSAPGKLDSVRFAVTETEAPRQPSLAPTMRSSLRRAFELGVRRLFWRFKRREPV